jgi:hypothetical protein
MAISKKIKLFAVILGVFVVLLLLALYVRLQMMGDSLEEARKYEAKIFAENNKNQNWPDPPSSILQHCRDSQGKLAMQGEDWNHSDVFDPSPGARVTLICKYMDSTVFVYCEKGGYTITSYRIKARNTNCDNCLTITQEETPSECPEFSPQ